MSDPSVKSTTRLSICLLFPDLLGTYGDGGNAVVLSKRAEWRGINAEILPVAMGEKVPERCDMYLLGGGEDQPQSEVTSILEQSRALHKAVERGAVVLAVCAGMQILGESFAVAGGKSRPGLGLLDLTTRRGEGSRAVGEIAIRPDGEFGYPPLTGYENHGGVTTLGKSARPLGKVISGRGNDDGSGTEGVVQGRIAGTYLHGPVLARNAHFADRLLEWATGDHLPPIDDTDVDALRDERLAATTSPNRRSLRRRTS
jgi:CobQ-like glutamine amidotransferase family enzyme